MIILASWAWYRCAGGESLPKAVGIKDTHVSVAPDRWGRDHPLVPAPHTRVTLRAGGELAGPMVEATSRLWAFLPGLRGHGLGLDRLGTRFLGSWGATGRQAPAQDNGGTHPSTIQE